MKLLFCPHCHDMRKLMAESTFCKCRKSSGYYKEDGLHAVYRGAAIPVGVSNMSFVGALSKDKRGKRPDGLGHRFVAFILPKSTSTVTMKK